VFGIGLVFLGLEILQDAAKPLAEQRWVRALAGALLLPSRAGGQPIPVVLTQSTNSIALLSITLSTASISFRQNCVVPSTAPTSESSVVPTCSRPAFAGGSAKAMYQVAFASVAAAVMVPLFVIGSSAACLAIALAVAPPIPSLQAACNHVIFNVVRWPRPPAVRRNAAHSSPALARRRPRRCRPRFLTTGPSASRSSAHISWRSKRAATRLLDAARAFAPVAQVARQRAVLAGLGAAIDDFLDHLGEAQLSHSAYERINHALNLQRLLDGLAETLGDLARAIVEGGANGATARLTGSVVEGLDAVLLTVVDAMGADGADDRILLRRMSGDRAPMRRRGYLASDSGLRRRTRWAS
jgi:hypothetical protein